MYVGGASSSGVEYIPRSQTFLARIKNDLQTSIPICSNATGNCYEYEVKRLLTSYATADRI